MVSLTAPITPTSLKELICWQGTVLLKVLNAVWSVWHCLVTQANNKSLLSQAPQRTNSAILQPFLKADLVSGYLETSEHRFSAYSYNYLSLMLLVEKTCISFLSKPPRFLGKK